MNGLPIVVVVGSPNSGKSTLVNRLSGSRQAVVHETPGVTRDRKEIEVEWGGRSLLMIDTGGYDTSEDSPYAGHIREQVELAIASADVGGGDGQFDLLADVPRVRRVLAGVVAAGVDHEQRTASPLDLDLLAIAGHAGGLVDHGLTGAAEAVHQGGLAGVRRADDDDDGESVHPDSLPNPSVTDSTTARRPAQAAASSSSPTSSSVRPRAAGRKRRGARSHSPAASGSRWSASSTSEPPSSPVTVTCGPNSRLGTTRVRTGSP